MDFYLVLGLERSASAGEIKRAYRRLARRFHPDVNPGDRLAANQFRQILEAYETLIDPERRRKYDIAGVVAVAAEETAFGFEGFDFSMSVSGPSAPTFGDLFGELLQQRERPPDTGTPERGADLHQTITLAFQEMMHGARRELTVTRLERCQACRGGGRVRSAERRCAHCQGSGAIKTVRGHMVFSKPCAVCGGSGWLVDAACGACGGQRAQMHTEVVTINIPPGLSDGARTRVSGKGNAGLNGGENGDLYVTIRVEAHPIFERDGDDLRIVVPVAIHEAALGADVDVPTVEGTGMLRVPPGTKSGQRFRLRGLGVPSNREGRRGDLVVEVRLVLPDALDERSKELLREFGRINGANVRGHMHR